jgi:Methyltransferase domain
MSPQDSQLRRLVRKASHAPSRLNRAPASLGRFARALVVDPIETLLYVPDAVSHHLFDSQVKYHVEDDFGSSFHRMLGAPWPCSELEGFSRVWADIQSGLSVKGLSLGRSTYGEYSDADPALSSVTWCAVRHLSPAKVLETGVARGVTSRVILEAMSLNGTGHLWSLDLPHPFRPELHGDTAAAVPTEGRDRWTYVRGSSRRRLPSLVSSLQEVDMFVHDSLHTGRNMRFELRTVWPAMRCGGLALVDDVDNQSFGDFVREVGGPTSMVLRSADGPFMFGALRKDRPVDHGGGLSAAGSPSHIASASASDARAAGITTGRPGLAFA